MSDMPDIRFMPATELAHRIRRGELSPVEVMESVISGIEERNPGINAVVYKGYDEARERARAAEKTLRNADSSTRLGVFHGVPTLMKDLYDFKPGWPSTMGGVRALADYIPQHYCVWAERMEAAGAIIVGKTNAPVLGFRGVSDNPLFGPTGNPFDLTRNAGGSSGGSAAAVADGMVPFAEGTDAGGSIRIPSSWCGVFGFKQSAGLVPAVIRPNAFGGVNPFVHEGMITRTVRDAAVGLGALSGADPRDPFSWGARRDFSEFLSRDVRNWRIAYSPDLGSYPVDPEVAAVVEAAVRVFERAGAIVEKIDIDFGLSHRELTEVFDRTIAVQNMESVYNLKDQGVDLLGEHAADMPRELHESVAAGARMTALDLARDQASRSHVYDVLQKVFADYQLLLTPTVGVTAVTNATDGETKGPSHINGEPVNPLLGWCLTYIMNMTGNPAASVPAGLTAQGMPVGLQIIGRRQQDGDVLAASAVFEDIQPWQHTYPGRAGDPGADSR
ncbi:amidase [Streptomyces albipurpureus]|uniref:Amidase n=1 Tax=Streptomyces albipurpureus TaxID=2897419 RepID=A0ABT0UZU2_9ACTN|nr:amidase [Streptomyces sp. CWNU-1]MCM2394102.1 amidase [Streptomyces sp. CWNU-1]